MKQPPYDRRALIIPAALATALAQWWPAFRRLDATGFGDWQMVHHHWEAARVSLSRYGEWPLWNPYHCGGVTILGDPESQIYSPLFVLALPLGSVLAVKVFLWLHVSAALLGVYLWARRDHALPPVASAFAALTWGLCGCFAWDGGGGHATFLPFALAPWLLMSFARAVEHRRSTRYLVATALLLTLALLEGGTYPVPYFALLLTFEVLRRLLSGPERGHALVIAAAVAALTSLCGAIRLVPIALALGDTPRTVRSTDGLDMSELLTMLTARSHPWRFEGHPFVWPEYGAYVGWAALVACSVGIIVASRTRAGRHLPWALLLFVALTMGNTWPWLPWPWLHALPVFDSLRVPSRFAILATLYLALLAGYGVSWGLARLPRGRLWQLLAALAVIAHGIDLIAVGSPMARMWRDPPLSDEPAQAHFHQVLVSGVEFPAEVASFPRRNVGSGACYVGAMNWKPSAHIWHGEAAQARLVDGKGRVVSSTQTQQRFVVDVELDTPGTVVINQNAAAGFRSNVGEVTEDRGRLAVDLPTGNHRVELVYRPLWFLPSLAISAAGLLLSLVLWWRGRDRPGGDAGRATAAGRP